MRPGERLPDDAEPTWDLVCSGVLVDNDSGAIAGAGAEIGGFRPYASPHAGAFRASEECTVLRFTRSGVSELVRTIPQFNYHLRKYRVDDPAAVGNFLLGADYDDGWAAWINGVEVYRSAEMPAGAPAWDSAPSLHESSNAADPVYAPLIDLTAVATPLLQPGRNVLAVGVWNANAGSSDLVVVPLLVRDRALAIERGPYLQLATPTSMTVR